MSFECDKNHIQSIHVFYLDTQMVWTNSVYDKAINVSASIKYKISW